MWSKIVFPCLCLFMLSACAFNGGGNAGVAPESDAVNAPVESGVYFAEFADIPIPREMKVQPEHTFILHNQDGTRAGTQVFEGNVELQSLVNSMIQTMSAQGWHPRGVFQGPRSALIMEKGNNVALITATEGFRTTSMEIWVAQKINDGALRENLQNFLPPVFLPPVVEGNPL